MQNGGMAASLARMHFASMPLAAAAGVFSGVMQNILGGILAAIWKRRWPRPNPRLRRWKPAVGKSEGCSTILASTNGIREPWSV
jgi:hypothetical protein